MARLIGEVVLVLLFAAGTYFALTHIRFGSQPKNSKTSKKEK